MKRAQHRDEFDAIRGNLAEMGQITVRMLNEALATVASNDRSAAERIHELEERVDDQSRQIHEQCLQAMSAPGSRGGEARLVTGIVGASVDLELIGDYADEIATLGASIQRRPTSQILHRISELGSRINGMLSTAIEGWTSDDLDHALAMRPCEASLRSECRMLYDKLFQLTSVPGDGGVYIHLLLICKHLELIARHAASIGEQAVAAVPIAESIY
jgi:phosphate transport system protein